MKLEDLKKMATLLRIDILDMTHRVGSGHIGGTLSAVDILAALYLGEINGHPVMRFDADKPGCSNQDYFVLSKAHAAPAWYAVLAEVGFFPKIELNYFRQPGALLQATPSFKIQGVSVPAASFGQGLSIANGLALSLKMDKAPNRVYCLMGDGELQEGQVWEAALTTVHHQLSNVILFIDYNRLQADGEIKGIKNIEPIPEKWQAFGWKVITVVDGNNVAEILQAIEMAWRIPKQPVMILARTVKGKGVPFAENRASYHGVALSTEEMKEALRHLETKV